MSMLILLAGLVIAATILGYAMKAPEKVRTAAIATSLVAGLLIVFGSAALGSVRFVGASQIGIVTKNALGPKLAGGKIIATEGEMGVQAEVLSPGWHFWYWPVLYDVRTEPLIEIPEGKVGLVEARDGAPLGQGQLFAPEETSAEFKKMVEDAGYFLGGAGRKGPQSNVLTPGRYRLNTQLFEVTLVDRIDVPQAFVGVVKSNVGGEPSVEVRATDSEDPVVLAGPNEKGIRAQPLPEGPHPLSPSAFEVTMVSTAKRVIRFTEDRQLANDATEEEQPIEVRTSDGFTFPVDVRVVYRIDPANAPIVIRELKDDEKNLLDNLNSAIRAIFRNNAESVKALDYVNQRSQQEQQSLEMLRIAMRSVGVTVDAVYIGDVGNEQTLGDLLKTQTDREIARQELETFRQQQLAAEQQKELERTRQEAQEERRLATASYEVQIAEQAQ
ncbi:MAG: SPFH domain-containing protein, partial [Planctomycetota bacterium]